MNELEAVVVIIKAEQERLDRQDAERKEAFERVVVAIEKLNQVAGAYAALEHSFKANR